MHGSPPKDYPKNILMEYFSLHFRLQAMTGPAHDIMENKFKELDLNLRSWPRNEQNDPFFSASHDLAQQLGKITRLEVLVGFNEFCNPSLDNAFAEAVQKGAEKIIVVTPMMTPGGEHSEKDIPEAISRIQKQAPNLKIHYAWPFDMSEVAKFLADNIDRTMSIDQK